MLFDLFLIAKVSIIFIYPKKILLFIENLCCCCLKIAVCAPKIPIGRKKIKIPIRLKITIISKNCRLKIIARVRVYARMYARMYDSGQIVIRTHDRHTAGTQDTNRTRSAGTRPPAKRKNLNIYVCLQTMKKKYKKS